MSLSRAITGVISTNSRRSTKWPLSLGSSFTAQQLASFSSSPWKHTSVACFSSPATEAPASPTLENYKKSSDLPRPKEIAFQPRIANSSGSSSSPATEVPAPPSLENYKNSVVLPPPKEIPFQMQIANSPGLSSSPATEVPAPPSLENYKKLSELLLPKEIPFQSQIANYPGLSSLPAPPSLENCKNSVDLPPPKEIPFQPQIANSSGLPSSPATEVPAPPSLENYNKLSDLPPPKEIPFQPQIASSPGLSSSPATKAPAPPSSENYKKSSDLQRLKEAPFQPQIANQVHLVGYIGAPVQIQMLPNGSCVAVSVLTSKKITGLLSFRIPVIFQGDLAQIAACRLKENDLIYVTGQLSGDAPSVPQEVSCTNIQVLADKLSFVHDGYLQSTPSFKANAPKLDSRKSWDDLVLNPREWYDNREDKLNGLINPNHPDFKNRKTHEALWLDKAPNWVLERLEQLVFASSTINIVTENSWKNLIDNPNDWWDNRSTKPSEKYPDFIHKETGEPLWLSSWYTPYWASSKLAL